MLTFRDLFGCALSDDFTAPRAGFGAEIDEIVGLRGEIHVVLDDHDGVAFVDETVKDIGEAGDVLLMESDGGFLDKVEVGIGRADIGDLGASFGELGHEFDTLGFAS